MGLLLARSLPSITTTVASPSRAGPPVIETGTGIGVTATPPITRPIEVATSAPAGREDTLLTSRRSSTPAALVASPMWKPSAVNSCVNRAAAPVTPDALETIATAPSVINGMVVVVVGGSVVVVVVVDVVVVGVVVVVVVDVDVVVGVVV